MYLMCDHWVEHRYFGSNRDRTVWFVYDKTQNLFETYIVGSRLLAYSDYKFLDIDAFLFPCYTCNLIRHISSE